MPACLAPDELLFAEKSGVSRRPLDHTTEPTGGDDLAAEKKWVPVRENVHHLK